MRVNSSLEVRIPAGTIQLEGTLDLPKHPRLVIFAHGSGSSRFSPRNRFVARELMTRGIGTLLLDLLTVEEDKMYETRFDIDRLTVRLVHAIAWVQAHPRLKGASIGLFGASTGAAAALKAAAAEQQIRAVVSRGGRPDLAASQLSLVQCPTLLIVGGADHDVLELNQRALDVLTCEKKLEIVPDATHLFEEPGKLEVVASLATDWLEKHL